MKMLDIDTLLKKSISWDKNKIVACDIFSSNAKCDMKTKQMLKRRNELLPLLNISRGIDIMEMLDGRNISWHITLMFRKDIAIRSMGSNPAIGYKLKDKAYDFLVHLGKPIIEFPLFGLSGTGGYAIPSPPPLIPKNVVEIAMHIKSFQQRKLFGKIPKDYECEPMVLYKPDTWQLIKSDPALVAKIVNGWRVFAIWGDIVEQAEIISFEKT